LTLTQLLRSVTSGAACLCLCQTLPSVRFSASRTLGRRHFRCREESRRLPLCQSCHLVTEPRQWRLRRLSCHRACWITKSHTVLKLVSLLVGVPVHAHPLSLSLAIQCMS